MPRFVQRCVQPSAHNHILPQRAGRAQAPDRRTQNSRAGADCEENASDAQAHDAEPAGGPLTAADQTPMDIIGRIRSRVQARPKESRRRQQECRPPEPAGRPPANGNPHSAARRQPAGCAAAQRRHRHFPTQPPGASRRDDARTSAAAAPGLAPGAGWQGSRPRLVLTLQNVGHYPLEFFRRVDLANAAAFGPPPTFCTGELRQLPRGPRL